MWEHRRLRLRRKRPEERPIEDEVHRGLAKMPAPIFCVPSMFDSLEVKVLFTT